jgi:choline dehydrogenase
LQRFVREETLPGPQQVQTYDELLDYARRYGGTCYHASCTCLMGSHPMSVVDDELRVHGLDGLRVIDASVMPAVTSTNTNAPTIMIAEKGAARQRLAAHPGPAEQEIDRTDALYTLHLYTFKSDRLTI